MSELTPEQQEAIRAALGVGEGAAQAPQGPTATVSEWVEDLGLAPGNCPAGTSTDLYHVFAAWCSERGRPQIGHWEFLLELRGLGLGRKVKVNKWFCHAMKRESADLLIKLRGELGPRPALDWKLGALPAAYKGYTRSTEYQDDEYRKRKKADARRRREQRLGRQLAGYSAASGFLIRARGRKGRGGNPGPGPADDQG